MAFSIGQALWQPEQARPVFLAKPGRAAAGGGGESKSRHAESKSKHPMRVTKEYLWYIVLTS
jgi:hypothetical protein